MQFVAGRDAVRIRGLFRVQCDFLSGILEMPGTAETASHQLHDFLQLRESAGRRLRVGAV